MRMLGSRIEVDRHRCSGCGKCIEVCPKGVLEMRGFSFGAFKHEHAVPSGATRCVGCGACVKVCPKGALSLRGSSGGTPEAGHVAPGSQRS